MKIEHIPLETLEQDLKDLTRDLEFCTQAIRSGTPDPSLEWSWWRRRQTNEKIIGQIKREIKRRGQ